MSDHCQREVTLIYINQQHHVDIYSYSGDWHYRIVQVKYEAQDEEFMSPLEGVLLVKRKPDIYNGFQYLLRFGLG